MRKCAVYCEIFESHFFSFRIRKLDNSIRCNSRERRLAWSKRNNADSYYLCRNEQERQYCKRFMAQRKRMMIIIGMRNKTYLSVVKATRQSGIAHMR